MSTEEKKRPSSSDIIGLELIGGRRILYVPQSTLANAGGYFAACFGDDNGVPTVADHTDEGGRSIYFIARDGKLFEDHILPYIVTRETPLDTLSPFSEAPGLWRRVRREAQFYALDELFEGLQVTHSCPYSPGNDRGVLHWLGTGKGTKEEYRNPHATGAVSVYVGKIGDVTFEEQHNLREELGTVGDIPQEAFLPESRQALVQYRPPVHGYEESDESFHTDPKERCFSLWCEMSLHKIPTIVDLQSVKLRLTGYSLRNDSCGMTDWNLEGSNDGAEWTVLHEARNDQSAVSGIDSMADKMWGEEMGEFESIEDKVKMTQEFADRELRHTWLVDPPSTESFYRYFRILGSGSDYEREESASDCLHGVGLELYGDIHEE